MRMPGQAKRKAQGNRKGLFMVDSGTKTSSGCCMPIISPLASRTWFGQG